MSPLRPPRRLTPALKLQQRPMPLPNRATVVVATVVAEAARAVAAVLMAPPHLPIVLQPNVPPRLPAASIRCC